MEGINKMLDDDMKDILSIYFQIKWKLESAPELRKYRYHGWLHTKNHYDAVCYLAALENINDSDTKHLKIASLFHDTGYIIGEENHENNSVDIARKELSSIGYNESDLDEICRLIISTKPEHEYFDILEAIMKDADLEYIGRDYYIYVAELLRVEKGIVLTNAWRENQLDFLEKHKFITYSAKLLFNHQKDINIKRLKETIDRSKNLELAEILVKEPKSLELLFLLSDEGSKNINQIKDIIGDINIGILDKLRLLKIINTDKDLVDITDVEITELGKNIIIKLRKEV